MFHDLNDISTKPFGRNICGPMFVTQAMYCPRCAKEFESGTSYCRTCGLSLDSVAAIVKGEAETEPEVRTGPNGKLMRFGIGTFIFGLAIGLGSGVLKNLGLFTEAAIARSVFLLLVMVGMLLLGAGVVFPQKRYVKKKRTIPEREQEKGLATDRLEQLPSADRSVDDLVSVVRSREPDSVTEPTTRQLR